MNFMNMDEDEPGSSTPPLLGYFDVSNDGFAWRDSRPEQIYRRRADMDDVLIFDILLTSGGIRQPDTLFPPADVEGLLRLLNAIETSNYDTLKKECLVYFLLKWHQDGREERFQTERCIPPQFTALADAYWHLDTGINVARAVSILSDARLNTDFASKIIHAISLSPNPSPLIVQYVRTAKPLLIEPVDIDIYTVALAESSLLEAWQFQRTFNEAGQTRTRLLQKILDWCISPDPRPGPLKALLGFPFTPFEEQFVHKYALEPPKSLSTASIGILRDLICVRLIQSGKYAEAVKIDHQFASSTLNESKSNSQDRRKMVQDLYAALPLAERTLLDAELEALTQSKLTSASAAPALLAPTSSYNNVVDMTMSQSWEEVPRPLPSQSQVNGRAASTASPYRDVLPPAVPIPERSGAPRFGGPVLSTSTSIPAAPIIPISAPADGGIAAPRKSLPFTSSTLLSSRPRQSLTTQAPPQIFFGASTSTSTGGLKFPTPKPQPLAASTSGPTFSPASRKANAFYQPPPAKPNGVKRVFEAEEEAVARKEMLNAPAADEEEDEDMEKEDEHEKEVAPTLKGGREEEQAADLGFSVFGNHTAVQRQRRVSPNVAPVSTARSGRKVTPEPASRKVPPGAFVSDEEEPEDDHEPERKVAPAPQRSRSRTTRRSKPPVVAAPSRISTRTAQLKEPNLRRSLPGSLMDDDEEEEEEADHVAPLRQPSPPKRALRKGRSSTPSDLGDEVGEGMTTRRRSSRLTAGSTHNVSPEPASPKRKSRKSARAAAGTAGATTRKKRS